MKIDRFTSLPADEEISKPCDLLVLRNVEGQLIHMRKFKFVIVLFFVMYSGAAKSQSMQYMRANPNAKSTPVEFSSRKFNFTILFRDSTSITSRAKIDEHKGRFYLAIKERDLTRSITPSQTISISRTSGGGKHYVGIPAENCWLFKIVEGKINLYSVLADDMPRFIVAFQKGNGAPIVQLTKENVQAALSDDEKIASTVTNENKVTPIMNYNEKYKDKK
jgi:hypothetical protein